MRSSLHPSNWTIRGFLPFGSAMLLWEGLFVLVIIHFIGGILEFYFLPILERFLVAQHCDFDYHLQSYCGNFLAPPSIPLSRRQYDPAIKGDMDDLTTRFLGLGSDRLKRTIELSNGLTSPASKFKAKVQDVKPFFPHGRWTEGKTPRVSK